MPVTVVPVNKAGISPAQTVCDPVILFAFKGSFILIIILCSAKQLVPTEEFARTLILSKSFKLPVTGV